MSDIIGNSSPFAVVGSINSDLVLHTVRIPSPGETVTATSSTVHNGGKGANQAAAAGLTQPRDPPVVHHSPGVHVRCGWPGLAGR